MYRVIIDVIGMWVALNLALPAFLLFQRSPHFRHQLFHWTVGALMPAPREQELAHILVNAALHHR
jgi:hypothetical protein